ncbi:MAG: prepilin-type N-terminal cleavage/methylation domain-containing protein, partial [Proteobacteria bacterium]|nr:prepilin-type N-terminal cleavage/methylation domain-containing protein [Pseudomonadota bacterium]
MSSWRYADAPLSTALEGRCNMAIPSSTFWQPSVLERSVSLLLRSSQALRLRPSLALNHGWCKLRWHRRGASRGKAPPSLSVILAVPLAPYYSTQRGLSLLEVVVTLALGAVMVSALALTLASTARSHHHSEEVL